MVTINRSSNLLYSERLSFTNREEMISPIIMKVLATKMNYLARKH